MSLVCTLSPEPIGGLLVGDIVFLPLYQFRIILTSTVCVFSVGIYMQAPRTVKTSSAAFSPVSTYSPGTSINIEYTIRQSSSDTMSVSVYNPHIDSEVSLWQSTQHAVYGVLNSCIILPDDLALTDVQIKVKFFYGDAVWIDENNRQTALKKISIDRNSCPGIFDCHLVICLFGWTFYIHACQ